MAPRRRRGLLRSNSSVLVSVFDLDAGCLVFRFDVKRLFSDEDDRRRWEVLPLPHSHVACFRSPLGCLMDLAASHGGDKIVAATDDGHMMVYDATRSQHTYDHDLGTWKVNPVLFALNSSRPSSGAGTQGRRRRRDDDMSMLVAKSCIKLSDPQPSSFAALRLTSGGRLQPLPVPPPLVSPPLPPVRWGQVTSHWISRGRAWLSVGEGVCRGTFSYSLYAKDMGMDCWLREGSWVLPLVGRAVYAADLGGLHLGLSRKLGGLCAIDMEARPPVIRQHWNWHPSLVPTEDEGYSPDEQKQDDYFYFNLGGLAYLGGGRLCISWSSPFRERGKRMILALTAVQLTMTSNGKDLLLRKRRSRCYRLPPRNIKATVLPVL